MIRGIKADDLSFLIDIEIEDEGITTDQKKTWDEAKERMNTFIHQPGFGGLIYEENGERVGVLLYDMENKHHQYEWPTIYDEIDDRYFTQSGDMLTVYQLWVAPVKRRKGIARKLKQELERVAEDKGIFTIYTHTEITHQAVIDLNQSLGYRVVRIGKIWDDVLRVSLIKDLRRKTPDEILKGVRRGENALIHGDDLKKILSPNLQILDIRDKGSYDDFHLEGAIHVHWDEVYDFEKEGNIDKHKKVIIVCYSGQSSMHIAIALGMKGYDAYSLLDGMNVWNK